VRRRAAQGISPAEPSAATARPARYLPNGVLMATMILILGLVFVSRGIELIRQWPALAERWGAPAIDFVTTASAEVQTPSVPDVAPAGTARPPNVQQPDSAMATAAARPAPDTSIERFSATDPSVYGVLEDVAAELKRLQASLVRRETLVGQRETALHALEEKLDDQLGRLEAYKEELLTLAGKIRDQERAQTMRLVKIYEAMKPDSAADVFDGLDPDILLPIIRTMNGQKLAKIVAQMDPDKARWITVELARAEPVPELRP
jgi:flagellar motility protein MotE (MotC chaperone)